MREGGRVIEREGLTTHYSHSVSPKEVTLSRESPSRR